MTRVNPEFADECLRNLIAENAARKAESAEAPAKSAGPVGSLGVVGGWGSGDEPPTAEAYFRDRDAFVRYVEDKVNPARAKEGLSTCDRAYSEHLYSVLVSKRYRQPSGKTRNGEVSHE